MGMVIPLYPIERALKGLSDIGRSDLRHYAIRLVVSEIREGRDGMRVMRVLNDHKRTQRAGGAA